MRLPFEEQLNLATSHADADTARLGSVLVRQMSQLALTVWQFFS
jgi:hypothetical protein